MIIFTDKDEKKIRPFSSIEEMNELMVSNWNKIVKDNDIIYHLGDFTFGGKDKIELVSKQLKGKKRLILGNHDYDAKDYVSHFETVSSFIEFKKKYFSVPLFLTHFPMHEVSFYDRKGGGGYNLHGHIHEKKIENNRYINVCVEHINYTPISIEDILLKIKGV
jgi:calcineurin-like phosphoesterase family protein